MVSVASLLNHDLEDKQLPTPTASTRFSSECSPSPSERPSKKPRIAKDAAVFQKSKVTGQVRYPPHETTDQDILQELAKLKVFPTPLADIADYPRHIPYASEKKQLLQKTGREAFDVFQYTFEPPGHDRQYAVLWDYNIGLVRMTPFFKCAKFSKTVPAKILNQNQGLRDICHSITGGALVAQGYWIPFEAAKALAITFCYPFRHALVPLFGTEFLDLCIAPGSPGYSIMTINKDIIVRCKEEIDAYRDLQPGKAEEVKKIPKDKAYRSPWAETQRYKNSFRPVNGPTSMPIEAPIESSYSFVRTPTRTPVNSGLPSPAMSSVASTRTISKGYRFPSPRSDVEMKDDSDPDASPVPRSPVSSEGEVSPKTIPRKRPNFDTSYSVSRASTPRCQKGSVSSISAQLSNVDVEAAAILLSLRTAARRLREEDIEEISD